MGRKSSRPPPTQSTLETAPKEKSSKDALPRRNQSFDPTSFEGLKEIARRQSEKTQELISQKSLTNGGRQSAVDDSRAEIIGRENDSPAQSNQRQSNVIEISSDEETEESLSSGEDERNEDQHVPEDQEMADAGLENPDLEPPSFGELVRANGGDDPIEVDAAFDDDTVPPNALFQPAQSNSLQPPPAASLGAVLSQALRTNDTTLLESCLHTTDLQIIRSTIQRIESSLAASLLQKLAERLHDRPGRAGNLMVWVQWALISHGGYIASQPEVMSKLSVLHKVVKERASALQPLLSLKGKLDMLEAQMSLRRTTQRFAVDDRTDEPDETVIYVEGQDEVDSEAERDESSKLAIQEPQKSSSRKRIRSEDLDEVMGDSSDDDDDELPTTNGFLNDSDDDLGSDSENEDLLDDEAEETDADTGEELGDSEDDLSDAESLGVKNNSEPERTATKSASEYKSRTSKSKR
ncbi:MAG: Small subunit (SSU) processome component [Piccolia ochrophora]|nr:MAG: Small subunit (SSU) processome component [Piccolia ochrophora]